MAVTDSGDLHSYLDGWDLAVDIRSVGGIGTPPGLGWSASSMAS